MKYCEYIEFENGYDCLADVIAIIGQDESELAYIEGGMISSGTEIVVDVFNSFFEAFPNGVPVADVSDFTDLSTAKHRLVSRIFVEL